MESVIHFIDRLSAWFGKAFAWLILLMTFGIAYEIIARKFFNAPTAWAFDISYMLYGTLFMMAGAYALSRDGHVRGDFVYRLWAPRVQARVELVLYFVFFFPGILALVFAGWSYASKSWSYNYGMGEVSINSPAGVPVSQFKTALVAAAVLLFIQGIGQVCRCLLCIRTGQWLQQAEDVEEMESVMLREAEERREAERRLREGAAADSDIVEPGGRK